MDATASMGMTDTLGVATVGDVEEVRETATEAAEEGVETPTLMKRVAGPPWVLVAHYAVPTDSSRRTSSSQSRC